MVNYSAKSEKSADLSHPGFKLITLITASLTSLEAVVKDQDQAGINQQNWSHSLTPPAIPVNVSSISAERAWDVKGNERSCHLP